MLLYERINEILKKKGIKKKVFVERFLSLEPTLKSTGVSPSIPTIYNYLNGTREIKADLVPAIALALEVSEQELFLDNDKIAEFFKNFIKRQSEYGEIKAQQLSNIIELCEYAPPKLIQKVIDILEENKNMSLSLMKKIGV